VLLDLFSIYNAVYRGLKPSYGNSARVNLTERARRALNIMNYTSVKVKDEIQRNLAKYFLLALTATHRGGNSSQTHGGSPFD
jgi:hypothetical protein